MEEGEGDEDGGLVSGSDEGEAGFFGGGGGGDDGVDGGGEGLVGGGESPCCVDGFFARFGVVAFAVEIGVD